VVQELEKQKLSENVQLVDGGTTGFELIRLFEGMSKVIIVDAMKAELEVGAVVRLIPKELDEYREVPFSVHQTGISTIVKQATIHYPETELVILGVVVKTYDKFNMEPSEAIKQKIPDILGSVLREIEMSE
jgi:hydrogenase maturation protease